MAGAHIRSAKKSAKRTVFVCAKGEKLLGVQEEKKGVTAWQARARSPLLFLATRGREHETRFYEWQEYFPRASGDVPPRQETSFPMSKINGFFSPVSRVYISLLMSDRHDTRTWERLRWRMKSLCRSPGYALRAAFFRTCTSTITTVMHHSIQCSIVNLLYSLWVFWKCSLGIMFRCIGVSAVFYTRASVGPFTFYYYFFFFQKRREN
jgi:hypothetical protein